MPPQQQPNGSIPFWDFIQSLDSNHGPSGGVDNRNNNNNPLQQFMSAFPFGGPQGNSGPQQSRGPWDSGFDWEQGWGGPWGGHGRGRRGPGGPWGPRGRHAHHHQGGMSGDETEAPRNTEKANVPETAGAEFHSDDEKCDTPGTMHDDAPDPIEVAPADDDAPAPGHGCRRGRGPGGPGGFGGPGGRGGPGGCGGRGGFRRHGRGGPHHGPGHHHSPPPHAGGAPFDFSGLMRGLSGHPFFQDLRNQAENMRSPNNADNANTDPDAFVPPVDVFNTETSFVLHIALPGAKKEHIGVNWNPDSSVLNIAGVVHRPGDEDFLRTLASDERKVGMFERNVTLPPKGAEKDEIDGDGITAKMEDGVLVVTVPKVEKEWTEIRKVDIE